MPLCTGSRWATSAEQTDPRNGRLERRNLTHRHARGLNEASPPLSRAEKECHACVTLLSCLSKHTCRFVPLAAPLAAPCAIC